ncbi:MAG: efflux RND transporter periplasmic adaptor subunit [Proteobacteria bacterium]|nr:efflux RND transporter periplasmic adaptor subunit [Pseudomonadota bacterium]HQR04034.1 efflux RND transporter periplasmic adaptor subunit [Rhodocyclaceae bacterium]
MHRLSKFVGVAILAMSVLPSVHGAGLLAVAPVRSTGEPRSVAVEGVVEAVRQARVASQVAGVVTHLAVRAGDRVGAGQVLARIDARTANQLAGAASAQADAARATLELASREYERQKQLFQKQYISQAAMDRYETQYKAATAQARGQLAQAGAARAQSGLYTLTAPYAGLVADVAVKEGDLAMPGQPLMMVFDPVALRITATAPQRVVNALQEKAPVRIELPDLVAAERWRAATRVTVLPAADAATHTVGLWLDMSVAPGLAPGMFARVWLPVKQDAAGIPGIYVPATAVFRRAEMTLVYVVDARGWPRLRQIRSGQPLGTEIEVLAGLAPGERVAADPLAAARVREVR